MTTVVTISTTNGDTGDNYAITLTDEALERARRTFNPSGNRRVDALKCLAAAFYTELSATQRAACEDVLYEGRPSDVARCNTVGREAATAATHIQAGAMFAVSAATA